MEIKNTLNSKFIVDKFGIHSEIYLEVMKFLNERSISEKSYKLKFELWKKDFNTIYGEAISSELFLKHTYFIQILKILISSKIYSIKDNTELDSNYIKKKIFNFTYFFWTSINNDLLNKINDEIRNCIIEKEDLFSQFYQHLFISNIRHKRGEFFTPSQLVNAMIEDFYEFGLKILDPSCGSGNFLIGIILKILNSQQSLSNKIKAINQVYGFDVNPLAIITTKVSILLLFIENLKIEKEKWPKINVFLCDSLFPENCKNQELPKIEILFNTFDLIIGNPPWLTYKDLFDKIYQRNIRELSGRLGIKPLSQYITHIELAAVFFYAIPSYFLQKHGKIFFVMPKSVLNGDHCHKFRSFNIFNRKLEIWDFPDSYMFNIDHICLKAEYIGKDNSISIAEYYPIKTKIYDSEVILIKETEYSSLQINEDGAKLILPIHELKMLKNLKNSPYKNLFYQGATLVPRTLVFFRIRSRKNGILIIDSDPDILSRAKEKWIFRFENKEIEENFHFKTFLNMHLIPFHLHSFKDVFLPINAQFTFDPDYLQAHPRAQNFYNEMNRIYITNKKKTSKITTLYDNLNYWNKLQKQINNKSFLIVYNASGSNLKAAVINNEHQKVVVGSENYYYSSDSEEEVYYLSAILNAPGLSKRIKQIKSSRHIHKRPFLFPIPLYNENNPIHEKLAKTGKKCHIIVQELFMNNPKITADKVRIFINRKLTKINDLTEQILNSSTT